MKNSSVSSGRNTDGQRADFSAFSARYNETADVGPDVFARNRNHPPKGLSHPKADDKGPGAPAKEEPGVTPPSATVSSVPTGAPAPDLLRQSEALGARILHEARAC